LITKKSVDQGDTNHNGPNADLVAEGSELQALHLDVFDACFSCPLKKLQFVCFGILTNGSIESALTLVEVVTTHGFSDCASDFQFVAYFFYFLGY
jgi:hypothetical protein